jgi:hypothetical protein
MNILHLCLLKHTHHIGSQENEAVTERKEHEEIPVQELPERDEQGEELQECSDHRPSSFEKGKPQSIPCLPNFW